MWQQVPDNMSPTSVCDLFSHASQKRQRYLAVYYLPVMGVPWLLSGDGGFLSDPVNRLLEVEQILPIHGKTEFLVHGDLANVLDIDSLITASTAAAAAAMAGAAAAAAASNTTRLADACGRRSWAVRGLDQTVCGRMHGLSWPIAARPTRPAAIAPTAARAASASCSRGWGLHLVHRLRLLHPRAVRVPVLLGLILLLNLRTGKLNCDANTLESSADSALTHRTSGLRYNYSYQRIPL